MVNLENYPDFLEAAKESDALSLEGFFEVSARNLTLNWPVSELSTPKQVKVEASFHAAFFHSDWPTD